MIAQRSAVPLRVRIVWAGITLPNALTAKDTAPAGNYCVHATQFRNS